MAEVQPTTSTSEEAPQPLSGTVVGRFITRERLGGGAWARFIAWRTSGPSQRADPTYRLGENLRQRLRRPMTVEQFFDIATQCAEVLIAAHEQGTVHCEIKPEKIMLTTTGQAKILDFGVANHLPRSDRSSMVDRAGTMAGTPA